MQTSDASPAITHGPISGEVSDTAVTLWARGNCPGQMTFEVAPAHGFAGGARGVRVEVGQEHDFVGQIRVEGLAPGHDYHYTVALNTEGQTSPPREGRFRTTPPPGSPAPLDFLFGSCIGGQGHCRMPERGYPIFEPMLLREADFFLLLGDSIYADTECPSPPNVPCPVAIARDLEGFRARYRYNLEDPHYAAFLAATPLYITWDDHEIKDDFSGPALEASNPQLLSDGRQAFFEYWPVAGPPVDPHRLYRKFQYGSLAEFFMLDTRSYREPHVSQEYGPSILRSVSMLGGEQFEWLRHGLRESRATWKFVATSVPLSYPTGWPPPQDGWFDSWAGRTLTPGYEKELGSLLGMLNRRDINNVIFLAGDTHWPYCLSYDYDHDSIPDFYEFGSSPLSALPLEPVEAPDHTFNPTVLYAEGRHDGGLYNFGQVTIAESGRLTFQVFDWLGRERYQLALAPD